MTAQIITGPATGTATYGALMARRIFWLVLMLTALLAVALADILTGPAFLNVFKVIRALFTPDSADPTVRVIVHAIRLPMTSMALIVGASLGLAGAGMQTILGNPLASPYTLGFSAAAGFGAAVTILFGFSLPLIPQMTVPVMAFVAAGVACAMVYGLAHLRGANSEVMILAGIATLFLFQSMQSLIQYMAAPEVLQEIVFWLFGSLIKATWFSVTVSGTVLAFGSVVLGRDAWRLTALRLGDARARALGVNVKALRLRSFATVSLLTAGAVAFVGTIGFVGLVAPHLARMLVGEDQRVFLPMSALVGAFVLSGASITSKLISPGAVVPIGIVTALIGVPFLFALILTRRAQHW